MPPTFPNRIAEERVARGIGSPGRLAELARIDPAWFAHIEQGDILPTLAEFDRIRGALGDIEPERLYVLGLARTIGPLGKEVERSDHAAFWNDLSDSSHLLVSREEITWLDRNAKAEGDVDVFFNLSCGAQHTPHVLLDTVAAMRALGVRFAAGAGVLFCCGTNYRVEGQMSAAERMRAGSVGRFVARGATTAVHMCTQCQNTFGEVERRQRLRGETPPENLQMHTFIERTLRSLGTSTPWKRSVPTRALILRQDISPVHREASDTVARWLALVPGVEVIGFVDEEIEAVSGAGNAYEIMQGPEPSRDEIQLARERLAAMFAARGADTMAAMHHTGQQWWSRFASDRLAVRHPISILADALGVEHPDRYQAAVRVGNPEAVLEQTRPTWSSWGMREERARTLVAKIFAPALADGIHCACGGSGGCRGEQLIDIDVITGKRLR